MPKAAPESGSSRPPPPPPPEVAKIRREVVEAPVTCPLCRKILREATTINECLHTFCKKCIFQKLTDEKLDCCPVCNIDLGISPLERLRPDRSLQQIRAKLFPHEEVKTPEVPSVTLPARRKGRSLSSLVGSTPQATSQTALHCPSRTRTRRQDNSVQDNLDADEAEIWRPFLNFQAEVVDRTRAHSSGRQGPVVDNDGNESNSTPLTTARKLPGLRQRREEGTSASTTGGNHERKTSQFWFSLVAADDQEGEAPLQQLPASYLRLRDEGIPVSCLQKYLARRLDIANESEVEIMCQGQVLSPTMTLQNVVNLWCQSSSPDTVQAPVGSSGKDLVMKLVYCHSVPAS